MIKVGKTEPDVKARAKAAKPENGAKLLADIERTIRRFIGIPNDNDYTLAATYTLYAWVYDAFDKAPRLFIWSPTHDCGKSALCKVLKNLMPNAIKTVNVTAPNIFRAVDKGQLMVIDEFDKQLKRGLDNLMAATLNSGWERGDVILRLQPKTFKQEPFEPFGPMIIASRNRRLTPDLTSRCLTIELQRGDGKYEQFNSKLHAAEMLKLRNRASKWAAANQAALINAKPTLPDGFINRTAGNWLPLYAVADAADPSGAWHKRLDAVAVPFESSKGQTDENLQLLEHLCTILGEGFTKSEDICDRLNEPDEWSYGAMRQDRGIDTRTLGGMLRNTFKIEPIRDRIGGKQARGYRRSQFAPVWKQYGISGNVAVVVTRETRHTDVLDMSFDQAINRGSTLTH